MIQKPKRVDKLETACSFQYSFPILKKYSNSRSAAYLVHHTTSPRSNNAGLYSIAVFND